MRKKTILVLLFACVVTLFVVAGLNAAHEECPDAAALEECPDVITMKHEEAFEQHRMGIVDFTHTKHVVEYGYSCGECHHDDQGVPTDDIVCDDDIDSCITCHSEPGGNPNSSLDYFNGAIHQNCQGCHKDYNEEAGDNIAPVGCIECHPRS